MSDVANVLLALAIILLAAKLGGELFERMGQSPVLGELLMGALAGNLHLLGLNGLNFLAHMPVLDVLAELGIVLLLFEVGIASTLPQVLRVGRSASLVAVIGVIVPSALGFGASRVFFPSLSPYTHLFVGTILAATSVALTTRVLKDLGKSDTTEARIILGAAVIDDILGLIVLAIVVAMVHAADAGTSISVGAIAMISAKAIGFLVVAIPAGMWFAPRVFALAGRLRSNNVLLPLSLIFCFTLAWASSAAGLAPIVGAFAAGLILEDAHLEQLRARERQTLTQLLQPVSSLFLPVFFFLMGLKVDFAALADIRLVLFCVVLTVVAIAGKLVAGAGVRQKDVDRVLVGIGMIPRGEVGFVFAGIGTTITLGGVPVVNTSIFSAVTITVLATSLLAPSLVNWRARETLR